MRGVVHLRGGVDLGRIWTVMGGVFVCLLVLVVLLVL